MCCRGCQSLLAVHKVSYVIIPDCNNSGNSCIHNVVPRDSTASGLSCLYLGRLLLQMLVSFFQQPSKGIFSHQYLIHHMLKKKQYNPVRLLVVIQERTHTVCVRAQAFLHAHTHNSRLGYPAHTGVCSVKHFEPVQHHQRARLPEAMGKGYRTQLGQLTVSSAKPMRFITETQAPVAGTL